MNASVMQSYPVKAVCIGLLALYSVACSSGGGGDDDLCNSFAYVANFHSGNISAFLINPNSGALYEVAGSPFTVAPCLTFIAVEPSGRFAYVVHASPDYLSDQISGYSIDATTGALRRLAGSPFVTGTPSYDSFASISFDPSGKFAYVANGTMDKIAAYSVDTETGALTEVAGSPFPAGYGPVSIAVDPAGKFAYVANGRSYNISAFSVNSATGALTEVPGSPFPGGFSLASIAVDPSGKYAYATAFSDNRVLEYSVNTETGVLTQLAGSPYTMVYSPIHIAIEPSGRFVYVTGRGVRDDDKITAFSINAATGALAEVPGSPYLMGFYLESIAIDPSGKYVYVAMHNSFNHHVLAYSINAATGALTEVPGSPFETGITPESIATARRCR